MVQCAAPKATHRNRKHAASARWRAPRQPGQAHPGLLIVAEPDMSDRLRKGLEQAGFDVWTAASGWQALDIYQQHNGEIGAVVLDVGTHGLDGLQMLRCLRHVNPEVRACCMSDDIGAAEKDELLNAGALRVFAQPFELEEVATALEQVIDENLPFLAPDDPGTCENCG